MAETYKIVVQALKLPAGYYHIFYTIRDSNNNVIVEYNGQATSPDGQRLAIGWPLDETDLLKMYIDERGYFSTNRASDVQQIYSKDITEEQKLLVTSQLSAIRDTINAFEGDEAAYKIFDQNSNSVASVIFQILSGAIPGFPASIDKIGPNSGGMDGDFYKSNSPGYYNRLGLFPPLKSDFTPESWPGSPKCFLEETKILLSDGQLKPIGSIKVGDIVLAFRADILDGKGALYPARVSNILKGFTQDIIQLSDGTRVTPDHLFLTSGGKFEPISEILAQNKPLVDASGELVYVQGNLINASSASDADWITDGHSAFGNLAIAKRQVFGWATYNLTIDNLQTYVANGFRVHNDCVMLGDNIQASYNLGGGAILHAGTDVYGSRLLIAEQYIDGQLLTVQRTISFTSNEAIVENVWKRADGQIDDSNAPIGEPTIKVAFPHALITGEQIGDIFGSTIGQAISGDNIFAQVAAGSALATLLSNIGESLHIYFNETAILSGGQAANLGDATEVAFDDFSSDLLNSLKGQSIGAVSSFLMAELSDALDVPSDFGGQLLMAVGSKVTNTVITNVLSDVSPFTGLGPGIITAVGSFLGTYLAHQVIEAETTAGAIGGQIGGMIGAAVGTALLTSTFVGSLGAGITGALGGGAVAAFGAELFLSILIPGIGAFIGVILGVVIGDALAPFISGIMDDWFGQDPARADAWVDYNPVTGKFISDPQGWQQEGGPREATVQMAKIAAELLDTYHQAIGGTIVNNGGLRNSFYIWTDRGNMFGGPAGWFNNAEDCLNAGVLAMLATLQIAGGDMYVKRAIANTEATTLEELNGDLQIAQDFSRYMANKEVIDLLIAIDPLSAFSAGWLVTLVRAEELGITEWAKSDFYGGLPGFFASAGLDKLGTYDDLVIAIEGTTLKLQMVIDGEVVRSYSIEDFAEKIGYAQVIAMADGRAVNGSAGNDIWIATDASSTFNDAATANADGSNDILIGGAGNDVINAGLGWDFVRGNAGNDTLTGGAGNDALFGGDGTDIIYGDANTGLVPIPTSSTSDAAASNAPGAFDASRRTWYGETEQPDPTLSRGYTPPAADFNEDELHGGAGNDTLAGGAGEDALYGDAGNDILAGDAGNDLLTGGEGADIIIGGAGFDTVSYEDATAGVIVDLAAGTASGGDTLYSIEDVTGSSFADTLYGDAYANILDGGMGSDIIDGRAGRDAVSFFSSLYGVDVDMAAGIAITHIPAAGATAATTETDTLLNIEDVIGSDYDDTLRSSLSGNKMDGGAGNDTFILMNDDVDTAAGALELRGGVGIDTLDFSGWNRGRGVEIDLGRTGTGNSYDSIEKVLGTSLADRIAGSKEADIIDGGAGDDVFGVSDGRDVYMLGRGDGKDLLSQIATFSGMNTSVSMGTGSYPQYSGTVDYQSIYYDTPVYVRAHYDQVVTYGALESADSYLGGDVFGGLPSNADTSSESGVLADHQTIVFGETISYHDIFGSLGGIDTSAIDLQYDRYYYSSGQNIYVQGGTQFLTRQQLLSQLNAIDLTIGVKAANSYVSGTGSAAILAQLTDSITIQGGGLLPVEASADKFWYGFRNDYTLSYEVTSYDSEWGATYNFVATHQGTRYDFEANQTIERLGFEGSGHIDLTTVKYFKDGSAADDTLVADLGHSSWLYGGEGTDLVTGAELGDVLVGGTGNDLLRGGAGDDQYAYWLGDGNDIVTDMTGSDAIVFGGGIASTDIKLKIGKLTDTSDYTSFHEVPSNEAHRDLRIEIYNPATGALSGTITIIDFQATIADKLRFAGDYEITLQDFLAQQGISLSSRIAGTGGRDTLTGTDEADELIGYGGNDSMSGGKGDDTFYAHDGADSVSGGDGTDTVSYVYANGGVTINLATGRATEANGAIDTLSSIENAAGSDYNDSLTGSSGDNILSGGKGNDTLSGGVGKDTLVGGEGNDTLSGGDGDDTLYADAGNDTLDGGAGLDTANFQSLATAVTIDVTAGTATTTITNADGTTTVETDTFTNIESIAATDKNDILKGGTAKVTLDGGLGDDTFVLVSDDTDIAAGAAPVTVMGGLGTDTLDYSGWDKGRGIALDLGAKYTETTSMLLSDGFGNLNIDGVTTGWLSDALAVVGAPNTDEKSLYNSIDKVIGSSLDDEIAGTKRAETLEGGAGNDKLAGKGGADTLSGGDGIDTADYSASTKGVTVNLATGTGLGGDAEGDVLSGIENVTGSVFADTLTGDAGANTLAGLSGGDVLDGGDGTDTADYSQATGGVIADLGGATALENLASQTVTISGLPAGVTLTQGTQNTDGSWSLTADQFLRLGDILDLGGAPSASFAVSLSLRAANGAVTTRQASVTAAIENAMLVTRLSSVATKDNFESGASGWSDNTTTTGSSTLTTFLGRFSSSPAGGVSKTFALPGNQDSVTIAFDFYELDSWDTEQFVVYINEQEVSRESFYVYSDDTGHANSTPAGPRANLGFNSYPDQIHRYTFTLPVTGNVVTLRVVSTLDSPVNDEAYGIDNVSVTANLPTGTTATGTSLEGILGTLTGMDRLTNIENLTGSAYADTLTGDAGRNVLSGGAGDDVLSGGAGDDQLEGGAGNDQYVFVRGDGNDVIADASGIDKLVFGYGIYASNLNFIVGKLANLDDPASFRAAAPTEYQLDLRIEITDIITGMVTDTVTLIDFRNALNGNDTVRFQNGTETTLTALLASHGITLPPLIAGTSGDDSLIGTAANEELAGFAGNDTLIGGGGEDRFYGGAGNDSYTVDSTGDVVVEYADEGTDTVLSSLTYTAGDNVENVTLTGTAAINATGNALDNILTGNAGVNTLTGGLGNDIYVVQSTTDVVVEQLSEGTDTVQSSVTITALAANVENLTLTGTASVSGTGNELDNTLTGNAANNALYGLGGNDTYVVQNTGDAVVEAAGAGTDIVLSSVTYTLSANVENLTLTGTAAINATGNTLDNILTGNSGDNILSGLAGTDTMTGGMGNDTYVVDNAGDVVIELAGEGTDMVQSSISYIAGDNIENVTLTGTAAINATGNALDNVLTGNSGINILTGGLGNDIYVVQSTTDVVVEQLSEGTDTVQSAVTITALAANVENLTLTGSSGISGTGNELDNVLTGNAANNTLTGLTGNDTYVVQNTGDVVVEAAGAGTDTVLSSVTYTLGANVENLTLTGTTAINATGNAADNVITGNAAINTLTGAAGADTLIGGAGDDIYVVDGDGDIIVEQLSEGTDTVQTTVTLTRLDANVENVTLTGTAAINAVGNELANVMTGNSGANALAGGAGNDTLNGGAGVDTLIGGTGDDIYIVDTTTDIITELADEGIDTVQSSVTQTALAANVENITLTGIGNFNATGNALDNVITGNAYANILDGGAGADTLIGGTGNDTYVVDNADDTITEWLNEGTDTVQSSVSYVAADNIENLTLTGTAAINATGNALNNTLTGNTADNILDGSGGNDYMVGGAGNDTYIVDSVSDTVTEAASAGTDTILSSVTYTASANVENLTLTGTSAVNATGNALNNILIGNVADNTLSGGAGADTMSGGAGNDIYVVDNAGDVVTELADEGLDTVQSSVTSALGANVENLTLTGSAAINATGNELDNTLTGNSGTNTLTGGLGNDIYVVQSTSDVVVEQLSEGTDTVQSAVTITTLAANVENLTLTGTDAINGTGNALDNVITGNTADNTLTGLGGNDTYIVQNTGDVVVEAAGAGTDAVESSVTYTLGANVENLTLTGSFVIDGTGNVLDNIVTGNSANNILSGGAGNDTMSGGAGDDTYIADSSSDIVIEFAGQGTDTVQASASFTLGDNIENLTLTGTAAINATGNALNNVLTGNAAANILTGGLGDDTLIGGAGTDTMLGGAGNDSYVVDAAGDIVTELTGEGTDIVQSSVTYTLSDNVENLTLTGSSAINATGNTLGNTLTGNAAANTLSGGAGSDILIAGAGNDILTGGSDDDILKGDAGNDQYVYALGDGDDIVSDMSGTDTILFGAGLTAANLVLTIGKLADQNDPASFRAALPSELQTDLRIDVLDPVTGLAAGSITVADFRNVLNMNDKLRFADATETTIFALLQARGVAVRPLYVGTDINEALGSLGSSITADFVGYGGNDTMLGSVGNDVFYAEGGADLIWAWNGVDTVSYEFATGPVTVDIDAVYALESDGSRDDFMDNIEQAVGSAFADTMTTANTFATVLWGGAGNDTLIGKSGNNLLYGEAGDDTIRAGAGNDTASGGDGNDTLEGGAGADIIDGGAGLDTAEYTSSTAGVTIVLANGTSVVATGGDAAGDALTGIENLTGSAYADSLNGDTGDNVLRGLAGNDTLSGGDGNDRLIGGAGADTFIGGSGVDTADYSAATAGVSVYLDGTAGVGGDAAGDVIWSVENVIGTAYADSLTGDAGNNVLTGGAGADVLDGGAGQDTADYSTSGAEVTVSLASNTGTGGGAEGDTLTGIENLTGSAFGDILIGDASDNVLSGLAGDDTLNGGAGNDIIIGGTGADSIDGGDGIDTVDYSTSSEGITVNFNVGPSGYGGDAEGDDIWNVENITGTAYDDILIGRAGSNVLIGGAGNDRLEGRAGADILDGGDGVDIVRYSFSTAAVSIDLSGATANTGGEAEGDQIVNVENVSGSYYDDTLTGDAGANLLLGRGGNDVLEGGAGADILDGEDGLDTAAYTGSAEGVSIDLGTGLAGGGDASGDTLIGIENLTGSGEADTLTGDAGANVLIGLAGNDMLSGGDGDDILIGDTTSPEPASFGITLGSGQIVKAAGAGNSALASAIDVSGEFTLADNPDVTNATLVPHVTIAATGDGTVDYYKVVVTNPNSAITLDIDYGTVGGIDSYLKLFDELGTVLAENDDSGVSAGAGGSSGGYDSLLTYTFTAAGTYYIAVGSYPDGATLPEGGTYQLQVSLASYGGAHNDTIYGGAGNDTIIGGLGADLIDGGDGIDTVDYSASTEGITVNLNIGPSGYGGDAEGDDIWNVENIIGTAYDDILIARAGNNTLTGGAGADYLQGRVGDDTLIGGTGDDRLRGGVDNDTYIVAAGDGADTITEEGGTDMLTFTGAIDATDLWFAQEDTNLVIYHLGTTGRVTVNNWFTDPINQVETIQAQAFGKELYAGDVNSLISQMASFAAQVGTDPSAVQPSQMTDEYRVAVNTVWHPAA